MDLLDGIILALVLLATYTGYRRGALLQLFTYTGLLGGLVLGAVLAPRFAGLAHDRFMQSLIALGSFFALAGIGDAVGWLIGSRFWRLARTSKLGIVDSAGGSFLGIVVVLLAAWFIGFNLSNGPFPSVARQIQGSAIVRALNGALPNPPYLLGEVRKFLNRYGFPEVFEGLPKAPAGPVKPPTGKQARTAFEKLSASTVRIVGAACGHVQEGSGLLVADHYVVTNAHVLAGMAEPQVQNQGMDQRAVPVLFDSRLDIAVLRVPNTPWPVLRLDTGAVSRGAKGAVAGYPGGGGLKGEPAAVLRLLHAVGRDIYGKSSVSRDVYELQSVVRPGNSGGPFGLVEGSVAGVVFAASTTDPHVGYAITSTEVAPDVQRAVGRSAPVSTGPCTR
ncbi:MAG: MarP family serine protease [Actinomycetota bacterium]